MRAAHVRTVGRLGSPSTTIAVGLISFLTVAIKLFGGAINRKMLEKNTNMVMKLAEGQKEIVAELKKIGGSAGEEHGGAGRDHPPIVRDISS